MFRGSFQWVSRVFERNSKGISGMFQICFKEVSRVLQGIVKGVSRKFHGCFNENWSVFQWSFKWVSRVFKRSSRGVWGKFQRVFQGSFKCVSRWRGVPRDLENFKGASQVSKRSSRQFQRHLKEVLGFLVSLRKFQKKFQWCFKNVSMKFFFAILLLQGSHHSYPSRRRACFKTN